MTRCLLLAAAVVLLALVVWLLWPALAALGAAALAWRLTGRRLFPRGFWGRTVPLWWGAVSAHRIARQVRPCRRGVRPSSVRAPRRLRRPSGFGGEIPF